MKLHRNLGEAAVALLDAIFAGQVAERAVERALKANPRWGSRDRSWLAGAVYDTVRWRRLFAAAVEADDSWALLAAYVLRQGGELPAWEEWRAVDAARVSARLIAGDWPRATRESIPDWLDELGTRELPERWDAELTALNQPAAVTLRANTLKISRDALLQRLTAQGVAVEPVAELPDAIRLSGRKAVTRLPEFRDGLFEVQDGASQLVVPFLGVEPGMHVVDACAGAGGKTLHLAAYLRNQGAVVAVDVEPGKLEELQRRAARAGAGGVRTIPAEPKNFGRFMDSADRLLLDVPCSGLGTLRRQPDLKWRLTPEFIENVKQTQRQILSSYPSMLKPGGVMVYSTCSILPSEDEAQAQWFLENNPEFVLEAEKRVWPSESEFDGFYMARIRRN